MKITPDKTVDIPGKNWGYLPFLEADGVTQMSLDEQLLNLHLAGKIPSILRFYTWKPATISLGYHQRKYPQTWHDLTYQGQKIAIVRRPSGGRAVLHQGDLTYAIITSNLPGDRRQVYETLCEFLIAGFRKLGIDLHYGDKRRNYTHRENCFQVQTSADLVTTDGYKLIGSAQLRRRQGILQHGSIRLAPDPTLYRQVFQTAIASPPLPQDISPQDIITTLQHSFGHCYSPQTQALQPFTWGEVGMAIAVGDPHLFPKDSDNKQ